MIACCRAGPSTAEWCLHLLYLVILFQAYLSLAREANSSKRLRNLSPRGSDRKWEATRAVGGGGRTRGRSVGWGNEPFVILCTPRNLFLVSASSMVMSAQSNLGLPTLRLELTCLSFLEWWKTKDLVRSGVRRSKEVT